MRHYYYSDNELQFGPFTLDELKEKRLKKSTLVWTDGFEDWIMADKVDELKDIVISEPPPLPQKETTNQTDTVIIKQKGSPPTNTKYDKSYQKETAATTVGITVFIIALSLVILQHFIIVDEKSYYIYRSFGAIINLVYRLTVTIWIVNIAKRQNRNSTGWGWFAFFLPTLALIIIGQLRKLKLKIVIDGDLPKSAQVSKLIAKANELYSENRIRETIQVLNSVLELDNQNHEALLLRALSFYQKEEYEKAKKDFEVLKEAKQFPGQVNLHLGIIESLDYNYDKAIELWRIAKEKGNAQAQVFLDHYSNYKGKYLLSLTEVTNKLGNTKMEERLSLGHRNGQYLKGIPQADCISQIDKFYTEITLHKCGFRLTLSKAFKTYHLGFSYTEIRDITRIDKTLNFILFDKLTLSLTYDSKKDTNNNIELIFKDFTYETGIFPTAKEVD